MIRLFLLLSISFFAARCGTGTSTGSDNTGGGSVTLTPPVINALIALPGGSDTLGSGDSAAYPGEFPRHRVTLAAFEIQTYEFTWHDLCEVLNDTSIMPGDDSTFVLSDTDNTLRYRGAPCLYLDSGFISAVNALDSVKVNDSTFSYGHHLVFTPVDSRRNYPVTGISWTGAALVCNLKSMRDTLTLCYDSLLQLHMDSSGYRLPTEAEWEHVARGGRSGDSAFYPTGASIDRYHANYRWDLYEGRVLPVGVFPANPLGLYDLAGNVWEWCSDYYGAYSAAGAADPVNLSPGTDSARVMRGGSHREDAAHLRTTARAASPSGVLYSGLGFRMVRRP